MTIDPADLLVSPLGNARGLPAKWCIDPGILELELGAVFGRTWQFAGRLEHVVAPGSYFTYEIASEPLLIVRGHDGILRALSNVCRHRAAPVADGSGTTRVFQCPYHGWTYDLDGSLRAVPNFTDAVGFHKADHCLPRFRIETAGPFVFVAFDHRIAPLGLSMGELLKRFQSFGFERFRFRSRVTYQVACNWKTAVFNGTECHHCRYVHRDSYCHVVTPEKQRITEWGTDWVIWSYDLLHSGTRGQGAATLSAPESAESGVTSERHATQLYAAYLFPNVFLSMAGNHLAATHILPAGAERCIVVRDSYLPVAETESVDMVDERIVALRERTIQEDNAICERVQRNLRSRHYTQGRLSPERERIVHFFESRYRMLMAESLSGVPEESRRAVSTMVCRPPVE